MRLAANEIERSLQQAADERRSAGHRATPAQLDELAGAFRRADEMGRRPFGRAYVKGRKDGVEREVLTTSFTEDHKGSSYRWVLLPYTEAQQTFRRRSTSEYLYRRMRWNAATKEYVPDPALPWGRRRPPRQSLEASGIEARALVPCFHHLLLVREDRLRR